MFEFLFAPALIFGVFARVCPFHWKRLDEGDECPSCKNMSDDPRENDPVESLYGIVRGGLVALAGWVIIGCTSTMIWNWIF